MALLGCGSSPKEKITNNKGTFTYPSGVIATKTLLVASGSHHGGILHLKHVDIHLALFLSPLLIVEVDTQSIEVECWCGTHRIPCKEERRSSLTRILPM